jgi:hypothetical protein
MDIDIDNLSDEILKFCLSRHSQMQSPDWDLAHYFANKFADVKASKDGFGFVEAGRKAVDIALQELVDAHYIANYGKNYRLTGSGRTFAIDGGYSGALKKQRADRKRAFWFGFLALVISVIGLLVAIGQLSCKH